MNRGLTDILGSSIVGERLLRALGAETEVPCDLASSRSRWGTDAQRAKLGRIPRAGVLRVAVIGDSERGRFFYQRWWSPGKDVYLRQIRAIHARRPDFFIQLGDFVSRARADHYRRYVGFLDKNVTLPVFHVIGNHERARTGPGPADKTLFRAIFGEATDYFLDHRGWRFVMLDSSDYGLTRRQLDWLDEALDTPDRKLVFTHMGPAVLKDKLRSPGQRGKTAWLPPLSYFEKGSRDFAEIVASRSVESVHLGHIHAFGFAEHRGVRYVLSGGGGSPLYSIPPTLPKRRKPHFILLDLGRDGARETVHELDGASFELG